MARVGRDFSVVLFGIWCSWVMMIQLAEKYSKYNHSMSSSFFSFYFFYFFYFWREKYVFFDSTTATQYCMLQKIRVTNHVGHNVNALRIALRNSPRYHCWSIDRMHHIIQATIDLERRYRYEIKQITLSSFFRIKA